MRKKNNLKAIQAEILLTFYSTGCKNEFCHPLNNSTLYYSQHSRLEGEITAGEQQHTLEPLFPKLMGLLLFFHLVFMKSVDLNRRRCKLRVV